MDDTDRLLALMDLEKELNSPIYHRLNLYYLLDLRNEVSREIRKIKMMK